VNIIFNYEVHTYQHIFQHLIYKYELIVSLLFTGQFVFNKQLKCIPLNIKHHYEANIFNIIIE